MKKLMLIVVVLLAAGALFAGEGKSCDRSQAAKAVQLTGTVVVESGADGEVRVFRVADSDKAYSICHKSTADLAKLNGSKVRVSGKLVSCDEGQELVIDKIAKI
ncbi:MAG TPA: hypothetical protein VMS98_07885 [Thermoanaerobaculia bacterium]|nr:hypothetical protein [Thermoanaerobaculia bacterium]